MAGSHHGPAGLGRAALDVGSQLLHRARARARQGRGGRARQRAADGGVGVNPIHPALAPLATAAKKKSWSELDDTLAAALSKPSWMRPEHPVGGPTGPMRPPPYLDPPGAFLLP